MQIDTHIDTEAGQGGVPDPAAPARDRLLDVLRFLALQLFVVILVAELPLFPWGVTAMGLTLAVSGSLMARQLTDASTEWVGVLWARLRRVLLPLWAFAAVLVPIMLYAAHRGGELGPELPTQLWSWVLPVVPPPVTGAFVHLVPALPYLVVHTILLLVSAPLLWLVRRWPRVVFAISWALILLQELRLIPSDSRVTEVLGLVAVFTGCWLVGFRHHSVDSTRWAWRWTVSLVVLATGATVLWGMLISGWGAVRAGEVPLLVALQVTALTSVLLNLPLRFEWLARARFLDGWLRITLQSALTAVLLAPLIVSLVQAKLTALGVSEPVVGPPHYLALSWIAAWIAIKVAVLSLGRLESRVTGPKRLEIPQRRGPSPRSTPHQPGEAR